MKTDGPYFNKIEVEMYVKNVDGFEGEGDSTKFGLQHDPYLDGSYKNMGKRS